MKLSIKTRLVLAMNLLAIGVGVAIGWAGVVVTGRVVEQQMVNERARNAAGSFATWRLPFSDDMMTRLRQVLGDHVAAGPAGRPEITATSLPAPEADALRTLVARGPLPRRVELGGHAYLVGTALVAAEEPQAAPPLAAEPMQLYLLVPEAQVQAARKASERTIIVATCVAILLATALAFWLSGTISRPIRTLANRMDALATHAGDAAPPAPSGTARQAGPPELARLAGSFDILVDRLAEAREQLARSARLAAVGQLSASVAHELKNPLSGIKMNAQVLAEEMARAGMSDAGMDRIIREVDRMNVYLEELLGLAASGAGPESPADLAQLPRVSLEALADSALSLVERRCEHGRIEVRRRWDGAAGRVRADETQIRQVILNLLLNAVDAMPSGGRLTVSTSPGAGPGSAVRFSVADTGKGVHVPDGRDVFEPFVTTKAGGVGLGLYVCRRNVERHGGRIGYDSSDAGATFWFELPAAD